MGDTKLYSAAFNAAESVDGRAARGDRTRKERFEAPPPRLRSGDELDEFRIDQRLSSGATAAVYRAAWKRHPGTVALKVLSPHLELVPAAIKRFRAESDFARRAKSPGVVEIYAHGNTRRHYYYAMDLQSGRTVADLIAADQTIESSELARRVKLFADVAKTLHSLHSCGIVHRDIKPSNLLLSHSGRAIVCDFGSALDMNARDPELERCLWGTVRYMSPEQFREGANLYDVRIDVYSLGLVLYEACTGTCPVPIGRDEEIVEWKHTRRLPAPRDLNFHISLRLAKIIRRATAADPELRYASAGDLASDLTRCRR